MKHEFTAEFTPALVKRVSRRFVVRYLGVLYFIAMFIMFVVFVDLVLKGVNEWTTGAIGTVLAFGILIPIALWQKTERSALSRLHRMSEPYVKFVLNDKGVTTDSELGAATVGWKSIEKIWEFPEAWALFVGRQQYITIPLSALTEEVKGIIKAYFKKNKQGGPQQGAPPDAQNAAPR